MAEIPSAETNEHICARASHEQARPWLHERTKNPSAVGILIVCPSSLKPQTRICRPVTSGALSKITLRQMQQEKCSSSMSFRELIQGFKEYFKITPRPIASLATAGEKFTIAVSSVPPRSKVTLRLKDERTLRLAWRRSFRRKQQIAEAMGED
ncbi:hypothetical protein NDN08_005775 [Rhodosorus marinus]|uniref:Uncharacterized protein n=1 Tax=Rhodosorus marinus TaxID=101924 RepID=A0AAV8V2J7_9RHOD|nr:hypothetical protein NDN08_005775 [Rhodosorus marinus]